MSSNNAYIDKPTTISKMVWYAGTDAIKEGEGFCYYGTYGTATASEGSRFNRVARPSSSNNRLFAGVAARNYIAAPSGQFIEIYEPGSVCNIAIGVDTTINGGLVTCSASSADAGRFTFGGFAGRGSARPLQTVTTGQIAGETDGTGSLDGNTAGAAKGKTLTGTGFVTGGVAAGDTVVIYAGQYTSATDAVVVGKYTVASVTSNTVLVLTSSATTSGADGALACSYYIISGNPKCLAYLMDGPESGLQEVVTPPDTGDDNVITPMVGGVTYINGNITIGSADAGATLADGVEFGMRKGFKCLGAMTTNDVKITLATAGKQLSVTDAIEAAGDGTPLALASAEFDAAGEILFLEWLGVWQELTHNGATLNAS